MAHFNGTSGNNVLNGTVGADVFDISQGGDDTVNALAGNDVIYVGATLTAADAIDGGDDSDKVDLSGDYSGGLVFGATTMVNVETLKLEAGNSYNLTTDNATIAAGATLTVSAADFGAGDQLIFDGSAETDGMLNITTSAANATLTGGDQADRFSIIGAGTHTLNGGNGNDTFVFTAMTVNDVVDGGNDADRLILNGDYSAGLSFSAGMVSNVETVLLSGGHSYYLTSNDDLVSAGQKLTVNAGGLTQTDAFTFDGTGETDGSFYIIGGRGNNVIAAGANDDTVNMGGSLTAADRIDGGDGNDTLILNGNYASGSFASGLTLGAATIVNIETITLASGHSYNLTTNDANVGAEETLTVNARGLHAGDALTFDGSAETDGNFVINGGAGNNAVTGGDGNDVFNFTLSRFNWGDAVNGGDGNDTLNFTSSGALRANALTHVSGIETINLASGANSITLTNSLVVSANGSTVTVNGNTGGDTIDGSTVGSSGHIEFYGAGNADNLTAGGGSDTFIYDAASDSTGTHYDTITGFNYDADVFQLTGGISGIDPEITSGTLNSSGFNAGLTAAMVGLGSNHAELYTPDNGTLAGQTFLVIDLNGAAGYQSGQDLVIHMIGATGTLDTSDFIGAI